MPMWKTNFSISVSVSPMEGSRMQQSVVIFVGPPGSSKELTRLLQTGADFTPFLPALRRGELALAPQ